MKKLIAVAAFLPLAVTLVWLQFLPDTVPAHYDFSGTVDRWGSKWEKLILPGVVLLFVLAFVLLLRHYERKAAAGDGKENVQAGANAKILAWTTIAFCVFFTVMQVVGLSTAGKSAATQTERMQTPFLKITAVRMSVLFLVLGNLMSKARRNSAMGFRCGWTQYNDNTWRRSNRFAGYAMVLTGIVTAIAVLLAPEPWSMPLLLGLLAVCLIVSLIYARRVYLEEKAKEG